MAVVANEELTRTHGERHGVLIFGDPSIFDPARRAVIIRQADERMSKVLLDPERLHLAEEWRQTFLEEVAYYLSSSRLGRETVDDFQEHTWEHIHQMAQTTFIKRAGNIVREVRARWEQSEKERQARKLTPGQNFSIYVNQGTRPAVCLAVIDNDALIEYTMPRGSTALRIVDVYSHDGHQTISYRKVPQRWRNAMEAAGTSWAENPQ